MEPIPMNPLRRVLLDPDSAEDESEGEDKPES